MGKNVSKIFAARLEYIDGMLDFIDISLKNCKVKSSDIIKAKLIAEETIVALVGGGCAESSITVRIHKTTWKTDLIIKCKGQKFEKKLSDMGVDVSEASCDVEAEEIISNMILQAYADRYVTSYKNGINTVTISASVSPQKNIIFCLYAMALAVVVGLIMRFAIPTAVSEGFNTYVLTPVVTIVMNGLKMLMAPIIFFSIASSVRLYKNARDFGRVGVKVFIFYTFTTIFAVVLSIALFKLIDPGEFGSISYLDSSLVENANKVSLIDTIVGIVPSNIFASFHEANTLQLIFLAVLIGICANKTGTYSERIGGALAALNELFIKIAEFVVKFLPFVVFASVCSMIITLDSSVITNLGSLLVIYIVTCVTMMLFYVLICSIRIRKSPFKVIKKMAPAWLNAYSLSSSNAAIPFSMEVCKKDLKISPRIFSFSIPFGATVNMDGATIQLTLTALFLIKGFGNTMSIGDLFTMAVIIIMLAMGTPGLPGALIMSLTVLCQQFNIPASGVVFVTSLLILTDPFITANNVMGDLAGTIYVAKSEKLMEDWD